LSIRWLHLSDIHERDCERYARKRMYNQIIEAVKAHTAPDLVFLTGDMAFGGSEHEYHSLEDAFIGRLKEALPPNCPLFTVPGNHDVDRDCGIKPRLWIGDAEEAKKFQAPDATGARKRKEVLLPRFAAYSVFDSRVSSWGRDWLQSEAGSVWWSSEIHGAKVAIVGVNTAWLCQDKDDWGRLTPGRYLLEEAIREAGREHPDLLIVLGHHPLAALAVEHEPSGDGERMRKRLTQANAIYLHGHLHVSGNDRIGDALRTTLTVQAPSAFQAHDNDRWKNGILWGNADLASGFLILEPLQWNEGDSEYKFDANAGYNSHRVPREDAFRLPLPGRTVIDPKDLPPGWETVDKASIAKIRSYPPSTIEMIGFFDGMLPTWRLVLAPGVQPRAIAEKLAGRLRSVHTGASKAQVVLLDGAGGEGKSTAILHAAAILIENQEQAWSCLYRQASGAQLPEDLFARLPAANDHAWVIVIDDADNIALAILAAVKRLAPRTDVHVLLVARDAEWQVKRLVPGMWQPVADFRQEHLFGLDAGDANRIVSGWVAWGKEAMGHLQRSSKEMAVKALLYHASDFATRHEKGELLGALLFTRQGEDMRAHVRTLINGLRIEPVFRTFSLLDIYAMIAAMHAENQLYLSRSVLAFALGCDVDELEQKALNVLRREAMLDSGDTYVLTRHRRIAEAACVVLREDRYDVDRWYPFLTQAAIKNRRTGRWTLTLAIGTMR
jgi:Calcineurin-like phosphoesterase